MKLQDMALEAELDSAEMQEAAGGWHLRTAGYGSLNSYLDRRSGPGSWAEGDWNGDGHFSSTDLVLAFTGGSY